MNNRYIFRGKRKDNGEWVEGNLINCAFFNNDGFPIFYILDTDNIEYDCWEDIAEEIGYLEVIPETVGQCTGLKDKNGKLIFEGDVVKDKDSGLFGKVVFATSADGFDGMTGFMVDDIDDGLQNYNGFWHLVEVIGNIYDNPDLLEVER